MKNVLNKFLSDCQKSGIVIVALGVPLLELIIEIKEYRGENFDGSDFGYTYNLQAYPYKNSKDEDVGYKIMQIASGIQGAKVGCGNHSAFQFWQYEAREKISKGIYELVNETWYKRTKRKVSNSKFVLEKIA